MSNAASGPQSDEINLGAVFNTLWRRKLILLAVVAAATGAAFVYAQRATPQYTAEAQVMLNTRSPRVVKLDEVIPTLTNRDVSTQGNQFIDTEIQRLQSYSMADQVLKRLNLAADPEFNPVAAGAAGPSGNLPGPVASADSAQAGDHSIRSLLGRAVSAATRALGIAGAPGGNSSPVLSNDRIHELAVNTLRKHLLIAPVASSYLLSIKASSLDPEKAALIANTVVDEYIDNQIKSKRKANEQATAWLSAHIAELQAKLKAAENELEDFREKASLGSANGNSVLAQQLTQMNAQLVTAHAERAKAEARLEQLKQAIGEKRPLDAIPEVLNSSMIQSLRQQETALLRHIAQVATRYRDKHPTMIKAKADLKNLREDIDAEVKKVVDGLETQVQIARQREQVLQKSLKGLEHRSSEQSRAEIHVRVLESNVDAMRTLYNSFIQRFKEVIAQKELLRPDAEQVTTAIPPVEPSAPKKGLIVGLGAFFSLFFASLALLLFEKINPSFLSTEQVEAASGLRVLALLPESRRLSDGPAAPTARGWRAAAVYVVRGALLLFVLSVAALSLLPKGVAPAGGNSELHVLTFFGLAVLGMLSFPNRLAALGVALSMIPFGGMMEVAQSFVPMRQVSMADFAADSLGVMLGIAAGLLLRVVVGDLLSWTKKSPDFDFDEAIRKMNTTLAVADGDQAPKVILVTSSVPQEGKTVLSVSLAKQAGRSGRRCLLVDADLRRPRLHETLGVENSSGLVDVLCDSEPFDTAVKRECAAGVDLLTSGTGIGSKSQRTMNGEMQDRFLALLGSECMRGFVRRMSSEYDLVIIDSPPVMAVSDARMLCGTADKTIFVVRWGRTRREVALAGLTQMLEDGNNVTGIVLSRVDKKKYAKYGFRDSEVYSSMTKRYYEGAQMTVASNGHAVGAGELAAMNGTPIAHDPAPATVDRVAGHAADIEAPVTDR